MMYCLEYLLTNKKPTYEEVTNIIDKYCIYNENRDKTTKFYFDFQNICINEEDTLYRCPNAKCGYYTNIKSKFDVVDSYVVLTKTHIYSRDDLKDKRYENIVKSLNLEDKYICAIEFHR